MTRTDIEGHLFRARLDSRHPYLWHIYDRRGQHIESFGGSEKAARSHVTALDNVRHKDTPRTEKRIAL